MKKKMHRGALLLLVLGIALTVVLVGCKEDPPSSENKIISFVINEVDGIVGAKTIEVLLPKGTDLTALSPVIEVSKKAKVYPESEMEWDFSKYVPYIVTAENKDEREYTVIVTTEELSSANSILSFSIDDVEGVITEGTYGSYSTSRIDFILPWDTDVTAISPEIEVSDDATVSPGSGVEVEFTYSWGRTYSFDYLVTAENDSEKYYTVYIELEPDPIPLYDLDLEIGFIDGAKTIVMYDIDGNLIDLAEVYEFPRYDADGEPNELVLTYGKYEDFGINDVTFYVNGKDTATGGFRDNPNENIFVIEAADYVYDQPQYVDIEFKVGGITYFTQWVFKVVYVEDEE